MGKKANQSQLLPFISLWLPKKKKKKALQNSAPSEPATNEKRCGEGQVAGKDAKQGVRGERPRLSLLLTTRSVRWPFPDL